MPEGPGLREHEVHIDQGQLLRDLRLGKRSAEGRDLLRSGQREAAEDEDRRLAPMDPTVQVLDPLVRSCHWLLALAFFANHFVNEEGETWHRWLGD